MLKFGDNFDANRIVQRLVVVMAQFLLVAAQVSVLVEAVVAHRTLFAGSLRLIGIEPDARWPLTTEPVSCMDVLVCGFARVSSDHHWWQRSASSTRKRAAFPRCAPSCGLGALPTG